MDLKKLISKLIKAVIHRKVYNFFKKDFKKKVLLSYVTKPFRHDSFSHTNFYEANTAAEIFDELGYVVDVIDYDYKLKNVECYDIIYGFGETIEFFYKKNFSNNTKIILYNTGMHQFTQNVNTLKRIRDVQIRKQKWLIDSARLNDHAWFRQLILSDAIITLGNKVSKKSFSDRYNGSLYSINAPFFKTKNHHEILNLKDSSAKASFIWFGSTGLIHKGLDLCLEYFKSNPHLTLHVCGNIQNEKEFINFYKEELYYTKNIFNHGYVDIESSKFEEILKSSFFTIFPTCSEGGSPSLLTVIGNGALIPIMTKEATIDVPNNFIIRELNRSSINKAVVETQKISLEVLKKQALENANFVIENNSTVRYKRDLKLILSEIIS